MKSFKPSKNTYYLYKNRVKPLQQYIKKLFILDFEATCEKYEKISPQEIIEFPCLAVNTTSFDVEAKFHKYVRPVVHPVSLFCTELTGITPNAVENEPEFPEVFEQFTKWLEVQQRDVTPEEMIFVTSGNWDLKSMFPKQCAMYRLPIPDVMHRWVNLKVIFYHHTGYFPKNLVDMHERLNIEIKGRLHSGIDDCYSILRILKHLNLDKSKLLFTDIERSNKIIYPGCRYYEYNPASHTYLS